jgi:cytochrome oxidase Cu insertion factor (SCO1/SenC/PrrC family)
MLQMTAQQPVSRSRLLKQAVESVALASTGAVVLANSQAAIAAEQEVRTQLQARDSKDQYATKENEVLSPTVGTKAPAFDLPSSRGDGDKISLAGLSGKWVVVYFYPADFTSGNKL